ncbi:ATP-binding protein [Rhodobacteraceae bacterium 63075]|nr:ATP-binding protein [Rhodobacteraceae bacterium 63075]
MNMEAGRSFSFVFLSGESAVRAALKRITGALEDLELTREEIGSAEMVLGEVLNNVVEHAYGAHLSGPIELRGERLTGAVRFRVRDRGTEMPQQSLPRGGLPPMGNSLADLPEGGFGWHLVHSLALDLSYQRADGVNELCLTIPCQDAGGPNSDRVFS